MMKKSVFFLFSVMLILNLFASENEFFIGRFEIKAYYKENNDKFEKTFTINDKNENRYSNVSDFLNATSEFNIIKFSKQDSLIKIDGFNERQYNVVLDGVPIYTAYDGYIPLNELELFNLKTVKFLSGVKSILYGPNNMAGTLSLESKQKFYNKKEFSFFCIPENEGGKYDFTYATNLKKYNFLFTGGNSYRNYYKLSSKFVPTANENGGKRENSDFNKKYFHVYLGKNYKKEKRVLRISVYKNEYGIPWDVFTAFPRYWRFSDWEKKQYTYNIVSKTKELNIFRDEYYNVLDSYDDATLTSQTKKYSFHSIYDDYSQGLNFIKDLSKNSFIFKTKVFYKNDVHRESDNYGSPFEKYESVIKSAGGVFYNEKFSKIRFGYLNSVLEIKENNGAPLRDDIKSEDYSVDYNFSSKAAFSFSVKHRLPNLKELFSGYLNRNVPNPFLDAEKAKKYALSVKTKKINLKIFYNKIYDEIRDVLVIPPKTYKKINAGNTIYKGADFNFKIKKIYFLGSYTEYNSDADYIEALPHFSLKINYSKKFGNDNFIKINARYRSETKSLNGAVFERLPSNFVADFFYTKNIWKNDGKYDSFYLNVKNVFDKNYYYKYGYPEEGRNVEFGKVIRF
jgi:iron complex outermembrane receptor protein